jgi:DNA mismatch repair protein MutS
MPERYNKHLKLKEYEILIHQCAEKIVEMETGLFRQVCQQIAQMTEDVMGSAQALAKLDVYTSFADIAVNNGYSRPKWNNGEIISIKGGRHPIVECSMERENFIANDTFLCNDDDQLIILTGPNMSGKSTYLRQVALIVLLAQIGSFIPADSATIGIVDRIFTRIGAQEDLATGQSTFMVEMVETANILNNATPKSLIILDEVGRGTSTYDGLSIAWAVVEFIHNNPKIKSKTLFATHYHELVKLAEILPRVKKILIYLLQRNNGKSCFLRKVVPGGADKVTVSSCSIGRVASSCSSQG